MRLLILAAPATAPASHFTAKPSLVIRARPRTENARHGAGRKDRHRLIHRCRQMGGKRIGRQHGGGLRNRDLELGQIRRRQRRDIEAGQPGTQIPRQPRLLRPSLGFGDDADAAFWFAHRVFYDARDQFAGEVLYRAGAPWTTMSVGRSRETRLLDWSSSFGKRSMTSVCVPVMLVTRSAWAWTSAGVPGGVGQQYRSGRSNKPSSPSPIAGSIHG